MAIARPVEVPRPQLAEAGLFALSVAAPLVVTPFTSSPFGNAKLLLVCAGSVLALLALGCPGEPRLAGPAAPIVGVRRRPVSSASSRWANHAPAVPHARDRGRPPPGTQAWHDLRGSRSPAPRDRHGDQPGHGGLRDVGTLGAVGTGRCGPSRRRSTATLADLGAARPRAAALGGTRRRATPRRPRGLVK